MSREFGTCPNWTKPDSPGDSPVKLGWPDLLIVNEVPLAPLLKQWSWLLEGTVAPVFLNKF